MTAGLAVQRTVEPFDSVPIGPWAGLSLACAWASGACLVAALLIGRRYV